MADITRLSRFVGGLPRDVDLTTNTPQVFSLKVGTTTPAELTKSMVELLNTTNTTGLPAANLSAGAKQSTLESKLAAFRVGVLNFVPTTGNSSDTVTTEVLGAAATDTAIGAGGAISAASAKGIFVGTVSGASDVGKVLIRVNGTDNGFDDGSGDEIYGVLSESSGVYTLNYKKADGTAYTITASDTSAKMDFYFIEVMDLYSFGVDRLLMPAIGGVVDATTASSVYAETSAREVADSSLYAAVDTEVSDRIAADELEASTRFEVDCSLYAALDEEFSTRLEADSSLYAAIGSATGDLESETSSRLEADSSLFAAVGSEYSSRVLADSSLYSAVSSEYSSRVLADSSLYAAVNSEYSSRLAADSSLQAELDLTQGSLGDAVSGTGGWLGFSGTNYLDAELSLTNGLVELDSVIYGESTTRLASDSSLYSAVGSEASTRAEVDSSLYAAIDLEYSARLEADSSLYALVGGGSEADSSLYAALEAEASVRFEVDCSLYAAISEADSSLSAALIAADSSLYAALEAEASVRFEVDCSLYAAITSAVDAEASIRFEMDCSLYAAVEAEASTRDVADSSLAAAIDLEYSARLAADSSLQIELDTTQGSIGDAINGDGSWSGFSGTNYLDSELTITNGLIALDTAIYGESTARQVADSSLQSQIDALNVSVVDVQYTAASGGIAAGDVVALSLTVVGEVIKADATGIATCETVVGVSLETATAGNPVMVRTFGEAPVTTDGNNFDLGKRVYAYTTAGQASKTPPSTTNNVVYLIGGATATNKVFVNTNLEYVVS